MKKWKRLLSVLLVCCMLATLLPTTVSAAGSNEPFSDVKDSDWFYDAVQYVYERGMMNGTSGTIFNPNVTTTRGMIVTILHRLEGTPSASGAVFSDVPAGQWCADAVAWASANKIANGYGNGKFGPNDPITREQMAAILYRYSQYKGYDTDISDSLANFSDAGEVNSYAFDAMEWAVGAGLIAGMSNSTLAPKGNATRAQVAVILMRFCENVVESSLPAGETYTVTFDYNYGNKGTYTSLTVQGGKTVTSPSDPTRSGYTFDGWYTRASGGREFDFDTAITGDVTLYAKWSAKSNSSGNSGGGGTTTPPQPVTYTVTFDSNGGSEVAAQTVENGSTVIPPANPTKEGYAFVGWFSDSALENAYDFSAAVTADITLYAKWLHIDEDQVWFIDTESYISLPAESNIVKDAKSGIEFVNNELIVHAAIGADRNAVISLINSYGGEIVGEISVTDTYQVKFLETYTYTELALLQSNIETSPLISWTSANLVFEEKANYYPVSDTKWTNDWGNSAPDGLNWGVEAINALNAWDYRDLMSYVNVGVFDCCFFNHEDLVYSKTYFNHVDDCSEDYKAHGTHISGTIAAGFDNGVGITGVAPYVNLYGFAYTGTILSGKSVLIINELSVTALLHNDKCRVLNCSNSIKFDGKEAAIWAAEENDEYIQAVNTGAQELGRFLKRLIDLGDNFVICVAAGNNNKIYTSAQGETTSGNVDAFYTSFYTAITDPEVKNRIIVVGSCKNDGDGTYTYSDFSNVGTRVDVVAPGEKIYSTINNNRYEAANGTSVATPHVAGIAAMLYAINPNLTGDQVKKIIVDTANTDVSGCSYEMVNAKNAVEYVARQISGRVVSDGTGISLSGATVYLNCIFGNAGADIGATTTTASDGTFKLTIPENATAVTGIQFEKDGYNSFLFPLVADVNSSFDIGIVRLSPIVAEPVLTPEISGIVKDANTGLPIENTNVYVYDENGYGHYFTAKTSSDGTFSITLDENATYNLKFVKDGYETAELLGVNVNSSVDIGTVRLAPIPMEPVLTPKISGIVKDIRTGLALENVDVYVYDENGYGPLFTGYTESDGTFSITLEENGTYSLKFNKDGYEEYVLNDTVVTSGATLVGTISLKPDSALQDPGDGTPENPYKIYTAEQLAELASRVNSGETYDGVYFEIMNDIDLSGYDSWTPIGSDEHRFNGNFNGNNYFISNIKITECTYEVGLFGYVHEAVIENVHLSNVQIALPTVNVAGGIAGGAWASNITNCSVSGDFDVPVNQPTNLAMGGIVGIINGNSIISNCKNSANIDGGAGNQIGGIAGYAVATMNSTIQILNCSNSGKIYGGESVGDIVGYQYAYSGSQVIIQ